MGWWCCSLRASSVLVCCLYLLLHTAALVTNFVIMNAPEQHVDNIIAFIDTNDQKLQESVLYTRVKPYLMEKAGEYLALPITVNLVLMVANLLASWGALTTLPLLLVPWLILYGVYALFAASLLAYMIVLLQVPLLSSPLLSSPHQTTQNKYYILLSTRLNSTSPKSTQFYSTQLH